MAVTGYVHIEIDNMLNRRMGNLEFLYTNWVMLAKNLIM